MIDLHIHSTASDGSYTPSQILTLAQKQGVSAISITDHDTLDGLKELLNLPSNSGPEWITGVEISCEPPQSFKQLGSIHLLGYGFSVYDKTLNNALSRAQEARKSRNPEIIGKLNDLGIGITLEEVEKRFGADQTGRPHIAELLKEKGVVKSFDEAFDRYLAKGKPAYVDKYKISCEQAIKIIHRAGGIPVLAHPGLLDVTGPDQTEAFFDTLITFGLEGVEVYYTDHDADKTRYFRALADQKHLMITGGSDFHGSFNQGVALGTGNGNLDISYTLFQTLQDHLEQKCNAENLYILEQNIGYRFQDRSLLKNALCHRSYLNENQDHCKSDNERLEFLGDAVLGLCIGHLLMEASPSRNEGSLSKLRSNLVSEPALAGMARQVDLGRFIRLGKGEAQSRGSDKNSILSDAFEALTAAVYLDAGFDTVYNLVRDLFDADMAEILSTAKTKDYKSTLQEYAQEKGGVTPEYALYREIGPDHDKTFEVRLKLFDVASKGWGKTKKAAEQDAARNALKIFNEPLP